MVTAARRRPEGRARADHATRSCALLVAGHASFGVEERELIDEVFAAGDRQLSEVMVPRTEVDFLDASTPVYKAVRIVADLPHSRYPVIQGSADDVVGFVHVRDLFGADAERPGWSRAGPRRRAAARHQAGAAGAVRAAPRPACTWRSSSTSTAAPPASSPSRTSSRSWSATSATSTTPSSTPPVARAPANLEVEGLLNLDDFEDEAGFALPEGPYETVAGYVLASLGHIPQVGETVEHDGHRITVTETDGRRVARLLVVPRPTDRQASEGTSGLSE